MKGTLEVIAHHKKSGKRVVRYYTLELYYGITVDIEEKYKRAGYTAIKVRLI